MPKLDQLVTVRQAARFPGVAPNALRNWCRQGEIPEYRHPVNNYRLFRTADLDALLRETETAVNAPEAGPAPRRPR